MVMLLAILPLAWSVDGWADEQDKFNISVERAQQYDSNLFRLPDGANSAALPGNFEPSEHIGVTSAALTLDKAYSMQRFQLSASVIDYNYRNFSYLSFTALNYAAAWQWSLTPRIKGVLSSSRVEAPTNYQDFKGFNTRNVHTDIVTHFEAEADLGGAWRVLAGLDHLTSQEEQFVVREGDASGRSAALGLRYVFSSGNTVTYRVREGRGDSIGLTNTSTVGSLDFDDRFHELDVQWVLTGKTRINARLGHSSRNYDGGAQRDFSGATGDLTMLWDATAKISVEAGARRSLVPYLTANSNYITLDRLSLAPVWKATSRIAVRARYEVAARNYDGAAPGQTAPSGRRDTTQLASLGVEWQPIRAATVSFTLQKIRNTSNLAGAGFDSDGASIAAKFTF